MKDVPKSRGELWRCRKDVPSAEGHKNLVVVTLPILFLLRACSESQPESVKKPLKGLKQLSFSLEERIHKRELFRSFRGLFPF